MHAWCVHQCGSWISHGNARHGVTGNFGFRAKPASGTLLGCWIIGILNNGFFAVEHLAVFTTSPKEFVILATVAIDRMHQQER